MLHFSFSETQFIFILSIGLYLLCCQSLQKSKGVILMLMQKFCGKALLPISRVLGFFGVPFIWIWNSIKEMLRFLRSEPEENLVNQMENAHYGIIVFYAYTAILRVLLWLVFLLKNDQSSM